MAADAKCEQGFVPARDEPLASRGVPCGPAEPATNERSE